MSGPLRRGATPLNTIVGRPPSAPPGTPTSLVIAASWCWRILIVSATVLALLALLKQFYLPVLPFFFAILLTALLYPLLMFMRRLHLSRTLATWATILLALIVLGGVGWFVWNRAAASYSQIISQVDTLGGQLRPYLLRLPGANATQLDNIQQSGVNWLEKHTSALANGALSVGIVAGKVLTGLVVMLFATFFLLQEGDRIWGWIVRLAPRNIQPSIRGAGYRAWRSLSGWIVGTALIAAFHGIVVGIALFLLDVPLAFALGVLVFVGSFIPIIGSLVFGGLAVLITLVTQGVGPAVIVVIVLFLDSQIEAHLLQPFIVGRAVRLHPLAVVLALTAGGLVGGIFGAIITIPILAALHAAVKYLTGVEDLHGNPRGPCPADRMTPEPAPEYAPLPIYAFKADLPNSYAAPDTAEPDLVKTVKKPKKPIRHGRKEPRKDWSD